MEEFLPCDHGRSRTLSGGDEEGTPKVAGDGDDGVGSAWDEGAPEPGDSEEDEYEKVKV